MLDNQYFLLNPPNPPKRNVYKAFAGGYGTLGSMGGDNFIPQFLVYASSSLESQGVGYTVLDAQALDYSVEQILDRVENENPDVLVSWISLPSLLYDLKLLDEIKEQCPDTMVMGFGTVCRGLPEEILGNCKVDALLTGYYPYYSSILALIKVLKDSPEDGLKKIPGIVFRAAGGIGFGPKSPEENIDKLNLEVYNFLPVERYLSEFSDREYNRVKCLPILTGAGCNFGCTYCPYPVGYGRKIVFKSVENIVAEIEFLKRSYGIDGYVFREQAFTNDRDRVLRLCDEIISRGLDIRWLVETRVDRVDRELLGLMKKAGCFRIHFGVETGDEDLLKNKGKPGTRLEQVKEAFSNTKDAGILTHAHVMVGFPDETNASIDSTIRLLKEINPDNVNINIVTPYPGTRFYDEVNQKGLILACKWSDYTSYTPVMRTNFFSSEELKKARRKIKLEFIKFKLKNDRIYRKNFFKSLPNKVKNKFIMAIGLALI